jgi:hypothetical protein
MPVGFAAFSAINLPAFELDSGIRCSPRSGKSRKANIGSNSANIESNSKRQVRAKNVKRKATHVCLFKLDEPKVLPCSDCAFEPATCNFQPATIHSFAIASSSGLC